jgi:3-phenylpropionate/trans-cinnamate dioxygenase ferredoxin reductase subunit
VNRPAEHMLGRKMLAAGWSPPPELLDEGPDALKAAFIEAQAAQAQLSSTVP